VGSMSRSIRNRCRSMARGITAGYGLSVPAAGAGGLLASVALAPSAQDAAATWKNTAGQTDWNTGGNWTGGTDTGGIPGTADIATFSAAAVAVASPNISSSTTVTGLNFSATTSGG